MKLSVLLWCVVFLAGVWCQSVIAAPAIPKAVGIAQITPVTRNASKSQATLILAKDGKAMLPIVVSDKATNSTKAVAAELAAYLKRISGAEFEVKSGDGSSGIVLGTLADFSTPALDKALEIGNNFDGKEAYAIRTRDKRLLLLAATEMGVPHAAFRFLEELGCRWFFPSKTWEVVPSLPTLKFAQDITDQPSILARRIWYGWGTSFGGEINPATGLSPEAEYQNWRRHNQQAQSFQVNAGHAWDSIIASHKAEFDVHPEYRALVGGKREGRQFCVSNAGLRKLVVEHALNYFKKNPNADMVSVDPDDTPQHCECEACAKLGGISDRVFGLANEVAKAVKKEHPGKMVGLYTYSAHADAPSFDLEPNIHVQFVSASFGKQTNAERLEAWPRRCKNMGFYDYYSVWLWDYDHLPGGGAANVAAVREGILSHAKMNATSIDAESSNNWGPNGRGYYVANKLMWNPQADLDAILTDFYTKAFGPAAPAMKRYYERVDAGNKPLMSKHLIALALRDVDEAARLAKDRPDVIARIDDIKHYLRYETLDWRNKAAKDEKEKQAISLATMQTVYRTRFDYLTHWEAIRQNNWKPTGGQGPEVWQIKTPYTRAETDKEWQGALAYFQPQAIGEQKKFSTDLVPVRFAGNNPSSAPVATTHKYQEGSRYAFYSFKGEAIEADIEPGTAWNGIHQYWIKDAAGKEISYARPKGGVPFKFSFKVPKPGVYYLDYTDGGAYWTITVAPGHIVSVPLQNDKGYRTVAVMQDMFFYVPKGTKQIEYYYAQTAFQAGGPHQVLDPTGKVAKEVNVNGDFVSVPVPPGMDGKTWRFHNPSFGHFWFFNVPNYLAASPNALLVPREVALKDGLEIRHE